MYGAAATCWDDPSNKDEDMGVPSVRKLETDDTVESSED